jgi:hypothetical protein
MTAYAGDRTLVHVLVSPGSENGHVITLGGLRWHVDPYVARSNTVAAQGLGPWESVTADLVGGAGGTAGAAGDYYYGDERRPFAQAGMWGLQRVLPAGITGSCPILLVDGSSC